MKKPIIFLVDDDQEVISSINRDMRSEYRKEYKILATTSAEEALESLRELKNKGEVVALFISDQRMPEMLGVDFLEKAKQYYPQAKRILLTAYSDTDAAIRAINEVQLDYYLLKPWDPPEEKLYPVIHDQLEEWQSTYIPEFAGIRIIGYQWSPKSHAIKDFLSGNLVPYQWFDIEAHEKGQELARINQIESQSFPVVLFEDGALLKDPTLQEVGDQAGMKSKASQKDVRCCHYWCRASGSGGSSLRRFRRIKYGFD